MNGANKKKLFLILGLLGFAFLGVVLFYVAGFDKAAPPKLSGRISFSKGISADGLNFKDNEVLKINGTLRRNRTVIEKASLSIQDTAKMSSMDESKENSLFLILRLTGYSGMVYEPGNIYCSRKKLVPVLVDNIKRGAKVIAQYEADPKFKNREVTIVNM